MDGIARRAEINIGSTGGYGAGSLTGLRPSPTRHGLVGFRFSGRLAPGPAVRLADRRHPLRLDVLTMTRSAYLQVRCAVVAQVERAVLTLHPLFEGWGVKLDSITPTLSVQDFYAGSGTSPETGGPWRGSVGCR